MRTSTRWKARLAAVCLASTLMASAVPVCRGADAPAPGAAGATPAAAPSTQGDDASKPKLLPEINVKDVALPDLIDYLRDLDPSFQAVVAYDPGAVRGEPKIQELRLK